MNSNKQYKVILSKVEWCGHCKDFLPVFNESKNLIKNNKTFKNISVDFETFDMEQDKGIFETKYKELVNKDSDLLLSLLYKYNIIYYL